MKTSKLIGNKMDVHLATSDTTLNYLNQNMTLNSSIDDLSRMPNETVPVFGEVNMIKTLVYGTMFFVSLFGNLATIVQMYRMRRRKSTVNTLIINLATADLLVTFFCMGTDAVWQSTVQWYAGDFMCKAVKFAQVFALNLSTCITVVISLDRCCVILDPMSRNKAPRRVRIMIIVSWCLCGLISIPQFFIFKVVQAPYKEVFVQCVDHGYTVAWGKKLYSIVTALVSFVIPLLIMGTAYGLISGTITRKSRDFREPETSSVSSEHGQIRGQFRSHLFRKAKRKALRMSILIVTAFIICWTPYYVLFTWDTFNHVSEQTFTKIMLPLSFIGLSNSVLNPMIYGAFHLCKVHNPRSWRRREWPSYSMKLRKSDPPDASECSSSRPKHVVFVPTKKNMVVLCQCSEDNCKKERSRQQCLFVLYKVNPSNDELRVFDSVSSTSR